MKQMLVIMLVLTACAAAQSVPPISPGFCTINRVNGYDIVPCDVLTVPGPPHRDVTPPDLKEAEKLAGEAVAASKQQQPAPKFGIEPLFPTKPLPDTPMVAPPPASPLPPPTDNSDYDRYIQQRNAQNAQVGAQLGAALGMGLRALIVHNKPAPSAPPPVSVSVLSSQQAREEAAAIITKTLPDAWAENDGSVLKVHRPMFRRGMYNIFEQNSVLQDDLARLGFSTVFLTNEGDYNFTYDLIHKKRIDAPDSTGAPAGWSYAHAEMLLRNDCIADGAVWTNDGCDRSALARAGGDREKWAEGMIQKECTAHEFVWSADLAVCHLPVTDPDYRTPILALALYVNHLGGLMEEGSATWDDRGVTTLVIRTESSCDFSKVGPLFPSLAVLQREAAQIGFHALKVTNDHDCSFTYNLTPVPAPKSVPDEMLDFLNRKTYLNQLAIAMPHTDIRADDDEKVVVINTSKCRVLDRTALRQEMARQGFEILTVTNKRDCNFTYDLTRLPQPGTPIDLSHLQPVGPTRPLPQAQPVQPDLSHVKLVGTPRPLQ